MRGISKNPKSSSLRGRYDRSNLLYKNGDCFAIAPAYRQARRNDGTVFRNALNLRYFITLIYLVASLCAHAQYTSVKGTFSIAEKRGCAPFPVTITIISPSVCNLGNPCVMDFEANRQYKSVQFTHTYTQAGTYWLSVLYQGGNKDSIRVQAFQNIQPAFDIYACNNNEASVKITDSNYSEYIINYNDGSPPVNLIVPAKSSNHLYTSAGSKTITVRGTQNTIGLTALDNCGPATKTFNAVPTLPVLFINNLTVLNDTQLQLQFTPQTDTQYRLEIAINGSPSFQLLQTLYNPTVPLVLSNLKTQMNSYCFRLATVDACTNSVVGYSNTICSAKFTLSVEDGVNALSWATSPAGVTNFNLQRNNAAYVTIPAILTSFNDTDLICKTDYCYQLITNYANGSISYSEKNCGTSFTTAPPTTVQNITAAISDNNATLQWINDPAFVPVEYTVKRSGAFLSNTPSSPYTDTGYTTEGNYCYQVLYKDMCDNISSPSIEACPIQLTGTLSKDNSITLNWTPYSGWQNGVASYTVEKRSSRGAILQTFSPGTSLSIIDNVTDLANQVYIYVVTATAVDAGLGQTNSNAITIIKEPNLYSPAAFTPNGDNLNDNFEVFGQYVLSFEMKIFDRWGELMYTTDDITQGWDGTFRGNPMPEGTYVFVAEIKDFAGRTFNRSGSTVLLRKN